MTCDISEPWYILHVMRPKDCIRTNNWFLYNSAGQAALLEVKDEWIKVHFFNTSTTAYSNFFFNKICKTPSKV